MFDISVTRPTFQLDISPLMGAFSNMSLMFVTRDTSQSRAIVAAKVGRGPVY